MWLKNSDCYILYMQYRGNLSSRFSTNSEAVASELIENLEEMLPRSQFPVSKRGTSLYVRLL